MASESASSAADQHHRKVIAHLDGMLTVYSDCSFERLTLSQVPACSHFVHGVASKDVVLDPSHGVWARIFLPQRRAQNNNRVPVVLYFHGGGFCCGSPAASHFHEFCSRMAVGCGCIWVSINYRLAPENPLPAAYDDAYAALLWLHSQASTQIGKSATESWLAQHADFAKCFLAGESAGATIVHFLGARVAGKDWSPLRMQGLLLVHPYFVQKKPVAVEKSTIIGLCLEFYHRSVLPAGAEWGHPWENPMHPGGRKLWEIGLPRVLVAVAEKEVFRDEGVMYYETLKQAGKDAELHESEGEDHCFHLFPPRSPATDALEAHMIRFING